MAEQAILVDTSKCIACKGCQVACKQWNNLSAGTSEFFATTDGYENPSDLSENTYTLIKFHLEEKPNGDPDWLFRKKNCMHCTEAACLNSCPKSTIYRDDNGFVYIDRSECIGCGTCVNVCPFGIPKLSEEVEEDGYQKSYKCWGCLDRVNGEISSTVVKASPVPACVKTCTPGALVFGDRTEMVAKAASRKTALEAAGKTVTLYGVEELGGLHYIYILLGDPKEVYGLPSPDELSSSSRRAYIRRMSDKGRIFAKRLLGKVTV